MAHRLAALLDGLLEAAPGVQEPGAQDADTQDPDAQVPPGTTAPGRCAVVGDLATALSGAAQAPPTVPVLVPVQAAGLSLAAAMATGLTPSAALAAWEAMARELLSVCRRHRRRVTLIDLDRALADPRALVRALDRRLAGALRWQAAPAPAAPGTEVSGSGASAGESVPAAGPAGMSSSEAPAGPAGVLMRVLAESALAAKPEAQRLAAELEAMTLDLGAAEPARPGDSLADLAFAAHAALEAGLEDVRTALNEAQAALQAREDRLRALSQQLETAEADAAEAHRQARVAAETCATLSAERDAALTQAQQTGTALADTEAARTALQARCTALDAEMSALRSQAAADQDRLRADLLRVREEAQAGSALQGRHDQAVAEQGLLQDQIAALQVELHWQAAKVHAVERQLAEAATLHRNREQVLATELLRLARPRDAVGSELRRRGLSGQDREAALVRALLRGAGMQTAARTPEAAAAAALPPRPPHPGPEATRPRATARETVLATALLQRWPGAIPEAATGGGDAAAGAGDTGAGAQPAAGKSGRRSPTGAGKATRPTGARKATSPTGRASAASGPKATGKSSRPTPTGTPTATSDKAGSPRRSAGASTRGPDSSSAPAQDAEAPTAAASTAPPKAPPKAAPKSSGRGRRSAAAPTVPEAARPDPSAGDDSARRPRRTPKARS